MNSPLIVLSSQLLASNGFKDVDPAFIRDWLIVFACFVGLVIAIFVLIDRIRGNKKDLATRSELDRIEKDIDKLKEELERQRGTARDAMGKIHKRIDTVAANTDLIKGQLEGIGTNVGLLLKQAIDNGKGEEGQ